MSTEDVKTRYGIDSSDFKTGIDQMNRALRVLESEFRANSAGMGDWEKTAGGLEQRNKSLSNQIEVQKLKVQALKQAYDEQVAKTGESSAAAQEQGIKLNRAAEVLNKMQGELESNTESLAGMAMGSDEAGASVQEMGDKTEKSSTQVLTMSQVSEGLKATFEGVVKVVAGLATAVAGLGGAITGLVLKASESADTLVEMSDKTGLSTTRLQELQYIGGQLGVDLDTMSGSLGKLTRSMASAQDGSGAARDAFKTLGVAFKDSNGDLLSSETVFNNVIDALGKVQNPAERDALAMDLFGKSAMELNPLIKAGSGALSGLAAEAHNVGAVVGEDNVQALGDFSDTLEKMKAQIGGVAGTVAAGFLPGFQSMADKGSYFLKLLANNFSQSNGNINEMASGLGGIVTLIAQNIVAQVPKMLEAGLAILQSLIQGIVSLLPTLLPMAVQLVTMLINFLVENLPMLVSAAIQILLAIVNAIVTNLPMLLTAAIQVIITLVEGIAAAIPQLIPTITKIIPQIILILIQNLPLLISAALKLIVALASGLIQAIPILIPYIPQIIQAMVDALVDAWPMIVEAGRQILLVLAKTISDNLPIMIEKSKAIVSAVLSGVADMMGKINAIGKSIIDGVWAGIQANAAQLQKQITDFFGEIVKNVKKALGIASPSTVFAGIGANMAVGLGMGFEQSFSDIERRIRGSVGDLSVNASGATAGSGGTTIYQLTAQYPYQSQASLVDTVQLLNMLAR